jgi:biopolymer transport protein ExbD
MKRQRRRILPKADINITPFIDILLVLLVIFMTITPVTSKGLDTRVPQPPPPNSDRQQEDAIVLSMDRNGIIRINRDEISASHLIDRLQEIFKSRNDRTVFVQADDALLFSDVAQLIDSVNGAGGLRVGLMTEQISANR